MVGDPGFSYFRNQVNTVASQIKATEGSIFSLIARHPNTSPVYINFYDKPSANVTIGTTVPWVRLMIPAASGSTPGQLIITSGPTPLWYFASGISVATITTDSDTGSSAPASATWLEIQYA